MRTPDITSNVAVVLLVLGLHAGCANDLTRVKETFSEGVKPPDFSEEMENTAEEVVRRAQPGGKPLRRFRPDAPTCQERS